MYGEYPIKLDQKGRFIVPKGLRQQLDEELMMMRMPDCLMIMKKRAWNQLEEKVKNTETSRMFYSRSNECQLDARGRILVPQTTRDNLQLFSDIVVIGKDNTIEVWDAVKWREYSKDKKII